MLEFESFFLCDMERMAKCVENGDKKGAKYYHTFLSGMIEGDCQLGRHLDEDRRSSLCTVMSDVIGGCLSAKEAFDETYKIFKHFQPFRLSFASMKFLANLLMDHWKEDSVDKKAQIAMKYRSVIEFLTWNGYLLEEYDEPQNLLTLLDVTPEWPDEQETIEMIKEASRIKPFPRRPYKR